MHIRVHICMCVYIYIYIYIYSHTGIHSKVRVYAHTPASNCPSLKPIVQMCRSGSDNVRGLLGEHSEDEQTLLS